MKSVRIILSTCFIFALTACGGSGGGGPKKPNNFEHEIVNSWLSLNPETECMDNFIFKSDKTFKYYTGDSIRTGDFDVSETNGASQVTITFKTDNIKTDCSGLVDDYRDGVLELYFEFDGFHMFWYENPGEQLLVILEEEIEVDLSDAPERLASGEELSASVVTDAELELAYGPQNLVYNNKKLTWDGQIHSVGKNVQVNYALNRKGGFIPYRAEITVDSAMPELFNWGADFTIDNMIFGNFKTTSYQHIAHVGNAGISLYSFENDQLTLVESYPFDTHSFYAKAVAVDTNNDGIDELIYSSQNVIYAITDFSKPPQVLFTNEDFKTYIQNFTYLAEQNVLLAWNNSDSELTAIDLTNNEIKWQTTTEHSESFAAYDDFDLTSWVVDIDGDDNKEIVVPSKAIISLENGEVQGRLHDDVYLQRGYGFFDFDQNGKDELIYKQEFSEGNIYIYDFATDSKKNIKDTSDRGQFYHFELVNLDDDAEQELLVHGIKKSHTAIFDYIDGQFEYLPDSLTATGTLAKTVKLQQFEEPMLMTLSVGYKSRDIIGYKFYQFNDSLTSVLEDNLYETKTSSPMGVTAINYGEKHNAWYVENYPGVDIKFQHTEEKTLNDLITLKHINIINKGKLEVAGEDVYVGYNRSHSHEPIFRVYDGNTFAELFTLENFEQNIRSVEEIKFVDVNSDGVNELVLLSFGQINIIDWQSEKVLAQHDIGNLFHGLIEINGEPTVLLAAKDKFTRINLINNEIKENFPGNNFPGCNALMFDEAQEYLYCIYSHSYATHKDNTKILVFDNNYELVWEEIIRDFAATACSEIYNDRTYCLGKSMKESDNGSQIMELDTNAVTEVWRSNVLPGYVAQENKIIAIKTDNSEQEYILQFATMSGGGIIR